jgi:hypothetical protein
VILEGPLLDLMMDTDVLKERIINGALADVFKRAPLAVSRRRAPDAAVEPAVPEPSDATDTPIEAPDVPH